MVPERVRAQIMAKVVGLVEGVLAWWMSGEEDKPFYAVEHKGAEVGREFARQLVQAVVQGLGTGYSGRVLGPTRPNKFGRGTLAFLRDSPQRVPRPSNAWACPGQHQLPTEMARTRGMALRAQLRPWGQLVTTGRPRLYNCFTPIQVCNGRADPLPPREWRHLLTR